MAHCNQSTICPQAVGDRCARVGEEEVAYLGIDPGLISFLENNTRSTLTRLNILRFNILSRLLLHDPTTHKCEFSKRGGGRHLRLITAEFLIFSHFFF